MNGEKLTPITNKPSLWALSIYENMVDAVKPGQRTLLVLKGTYTDDNGRVEENRFYTIVKHFISRR